MIEIILSLLSRIRELSFILRVAVFFYLRTSAMFCICFLAYFLQFLHTFLQKSRDFRYFWMDFCTIIFGLLKKINDTKTLLPSKISGVRVFVRKVIIINAVFVLSMYFVVCEWFE